MPMIKIENGQLKIERIENEIVADFQFSIPSIFNSRLLTC